MTDTGSAATLTRPPRSPGLALAVLCAATLMIILDGTIVTVALPSIQRDLGFAPASLTWVLNAYLIAFGGLLLLAGRLGEQSRSRALVPRTLLAPGVTAMASGRMIFVGVGGRFYCPDS